MYNQEVLVEYRERRIRQGRANRAAFIRPLFNRGPEEG
jgi:hypothetical protein